MEGDYPSLYLGGQPHLKGRIAELSRTEPNRADPGKGRLREGDWVEARYRGKSRYFPGKISRDRGDGSYDIVYDDGEKDEGV